jgi:hypothetical protein
MGVVQPKEYLGLVVDEIILTIHFSLPSFSLPYFHDELDVISSDVP